jgi:hypothetical protein
MTHTAVVAAVIPFEDFRELMMKWVHRVVPGYTYSGVFMNREDLLAEADYGMFCAYRRHAHVKPLEDLCKIATTAIIGAIQTAQRRSMNGKVAGWDSADDDLVVTGAPGKRRVARVQRRVTPRIVSTDELRLVGTEPSDGGVALRRAEVRDAIEGVRLDRRSRQLLEGVLSGEGAEENDTPEAELNRAMRKLRSLIEKELSR